MKPGKRFAAAVVAGLLLAALPAPPPARAAGDSASCAECGMTAEVEGRFTVRLGQGKDARFFCDIGDYVAFLNRTTPKESPAAFVHDFPTGAWVDARKALYVTDKRKYETPMGWGIAAFADPKAAAAAGATLSLEALRKPPGKP